MSIGRIMENNLFDIKGKVVLITGAARGIGNSFAEGFLKQGAKVVLNDIREELLSESVNRLKAEGYDACGYCFDISDEKQVIANISQIEEDAGPVDILLNNAGIQKRTALEELSTEDWKKVLDINLTSAFIMGKAVVKSMKSRKYGKIINISSINAEMARPDIGAYCTAKGGLKMLTKSMASEWGKYNINVNAIGPGYILTEMTSALSEDPEFDSWVKSEVPLQRWGRTEDLIGCAVFLASEASNYLSGQSIYIDGGWQASL